ncbi:uncharacterized protein BYT42DRAFT_567469 [Radiomyces spectabilis]|uniref:uncharacterized protein n=1 Tax=Radiomyces spectabilis TaxID=64574 RepID=UPI002220EFAF|nr:uncharacterized protein BYT42DRAFT_567469 [Radiomyces spectabilis]KAI8379100.1 hypothetical protein BYT42DRAFT_567469 [Radiomyces spectabilis]
MAYHNYLWLCLIFLLAYFNTTLAAKSGIPHCKSTNVTNGTKPRQRIAVISHDSAIVTFFHNPEQGARDAATILDIDLTWNRHFINSVEKMQADIYAAVTRVMIH